MLPVSFNASERVIGVTCHFAMMLRLLAVVMSSAANQYNEMTNKQGLDYKWEDVNNGRCPSCGQAGLANTPQVPAKPSQLQNKHRKYQLKR